MTWLPFFWALNSGVLLLHLIGLFYSLRYLRDAKLSALEQAVWAALALVVPVLGSIACLVIRPGDPTPAPAAGKEFRLEDHRQQ